MTWTTASWLAWTTLEEQAVMQHSGSCGRKLDAGSRDLGIAKHDALGAIVVVDFLRAGGLGRVRRELPVADIDQSGRD